MQKVPYVFPIVGGRKVEHLYSNLEALDIVLKEEHFKKLENAVPFNPGFPVNLMVSRLLWHERNWFEALFTGRWNYVRHCVEQHWAI